MCPFVNKKLSNAEIAGHASRS